MSAIKGTEEGQRVTARRKSSSTIEIKVSDSNGTSTVMLNENRLSRLMLLLNNLYEEMDV